MGVATLVTAPRALVDGIGNPGDGPNLSTMGVATELEVNTCFLRFLQVMRLMVQHNGEHRIVNRLGEVCQWFTPHVHRIVASNDD